jgi:hypothetical protein
MKTINENRNDNKAMNYTIIVPTKCISLLKAQDITICTFLSLYS